MLDQQAQVEGETMRHLALMSIRNKIRRKIQIINEAAGINFHISNRKYAVAVIKCFQNIVNAYKKQGGNDSTFSTTNKICNISSSFYEEALHQIDLNQGFVDSIDDILSTLNLTEQITLDPRHVEILRDCGIIKK